MIIKGISIEEVAFGCVARKEKMSSEGFGVEYVNIMFSHHR